MNMKKWMIVLLAVLLVVLACGGYFIWKNTSDKSAVAEEKYETFEETEAKLIPVNMSCEDKGIRVTVVGAVLTEKYLWIEYDLQDLEGGRLNHNYIYDYAEDWLIYNTEFRDVGKSANYIAAEPDHYYIIQKYRHHMKESEDTLSVKLKSIPAMGKASIQILPLLEQYGTSFEGVPFPEKGYGVTYPAGTSPYVISYLDSNLSLEQPFSDDPAMKDLLLGGIGWNDGRLHIQVHNADKNLKINSGDYYTGPVAIRPANRGSNIGSVNTINLMWDEDGDNNMDWVEFVIECKPEDLEELDYYLDLSYIREILEGNWEFNIPLDQIRASADVASEIDAIQDPEESTRIVYFEIHNGTGEAVTKYRLGNSASYMTSSLPKEAEGSLTSGFNAESYESDSIQLYYITESGYEYETTLPFDENIPRTIITMLSQEEGGGIAISYPEANPTTVPAGK